MDEKNIYPECLFTVTIENKEPIELENFVKMFTAIGANYTRFIKKNYPQLSENAKICIKEVRKGSIVADLLPVIAATLVSASQNAEIFNSLIDFSKHLKDALLVTLSKKPDLQENTIQYPQSELAEFKNMVQVVAQDAAGGKAQFQIKKEGVEMNATFEFNTTQARKIDTNINLYNQQFSLKEHNLYQDVLMVFTRTETAVLDLNKKTGDKAVIEDICKKALPVYYVSDLAHQAIKHQIIQASDNVYQKGFFVDVTVHFKNEKPVAYSIMNYHDIIDIDID